jgi:ribosomal protein S24E
MNSKVISQQKNPFLEREEITIEIKNPSTPNEEEVKTAIGKDANLTVIKKINTNFGNQTFLAEAVVYDNVEAKKKVETIPQKVRKKMEADEKTAKEAEKKAEAETKPEEPVPEAEAKPEEPAKTPAEEPKEEPKPEEKIE